MDDPQLDASPKPAAPLLDLVGVLETMPEAVVVLNRDWRIVYANPVAARLNGKSAAEFIGRTNWEEWPASLGSNLERQYRSALEDHQPVHFEHKYEDATHRIWLEIHAYPMAEWLVIYSHDITQRKEVEQALALSNQRFRLALGHTPIVVFEQDRQLRYTWVYNSHSIYSPDLILGRTDPEIMPGEYGERLFALKNEVVEKERGIRTEVTVALPEQILFYDLAIEPLRDHQGNVVGVTGSGIDITSRRQAEESLLSLSFLGSKIGTVLAGDSELRVALDECARLLQTGLDAAFVRIWLLNEAENVLELLVSAGQYTHLDGPHSRVRVGDFKIGSIAQERKPYLTNNVAEDSRISDPEWARREGLVGFAGYPLVVGERLEGVIALFSRQAFSPAVHLYLSAISDAIAAAVERKRTEKELREEQSRGLQVLESITDAFFALDCDWKFTYFNRRFEEIIGKQSPDLIGKIFWEQFPDIVGSQYEHHYREAVRTGKPELFVAYYPPLSLWTEVHAYPTKKGLSIYFQDISERKRLEEKMRDTAKLESLGVMAGGIAHDFNNLLTGILGNASLLAESVNAGDRDLASEIVKAAERAADLTRQMLAYSGKGRFQVQTLDLSRQVTEILSLVQPMIDKKVKVELRLEKNLPCIEADSGQIQQLVMNLIINGAEAMEGAEGRVIITTHVADVDKTLISHTFANHDISPGKYVCLEVQDTGCGMSEDTKAKIFDPFFTTKFTGRGLGLAAVSGIVRGHKGALRVYSSPGEGTTFKVFFPSIVGNAIAGNAIDGIAREPGAGAGFRSLEDRGTILLVDDEDIVRRLGRTCLERKGYQVIVASNGKEGVEIFRARPTEIILVILDMTMPVMGGEEALGLLRQTRPDLPVIVSSGYSEVEVIRRFTKYGVTHFIQKPYTASALLTKVKSVLSIGLPA